MKTLFCLALSLISLSCFSQDTTYISVTRSVVNSGTTIETGAPLTNSNMFFSNLPWWEWQVIPRSGEPGNLVLTAKPELYTGFEYDLSAAETAHFYNLGVDFGTDQLMIGAGVKLPNHSPNGEKQESFFSWRIYKRVPFKGISKSSVNLYEAQKANFQFGLESNLSLRKSDTSSEEATSQEILKSNLSPFIGLFHPIFNHMKIGIRAQRAIVFDKRINSYSSLSLQFSYRFE